MIRKLRSFVYYKTTEKLIKELDTDFGFTTLSEATILKMKAAALLREETKRNG